ncbi:hypothetical protein RRG08_045208 [Elysia crispata]|uniref:Uncharacterized protein n=1 Tax=Elysia crispata TaxID=231223 RepID=A0AAE1DQX9_9GAST|nr:hypothetical protein RRG08_045208 [Elysia crispata]
MSKYVDVDKLLVPNFGQRREKKHRASRTCGWESDGQRSIRSTQCLSVCTVQKVVPDVGHAIQRRPGSDRWTSTCWQKHSQFLLVVGSPVESPSVWETPPFHHGYCMKAADALRLGCVFSLLLLAFPFQKTAGSCFDI